MPDLHLHLSREDRELVDQLDPSVNLSEWFRDLLYQRMGICSGCGRPFEDDVTGERAESQLVT